MFFKKLFIFFFYLTFLSFISLFSFSLFFPLYQSHEIIIPYGLHPFNICVDNPHLWNFIKYSYPFLFLFSYTMLFHFLYHHFFIKSQKFFTHFKNLFFPSFQKSSSSTDAFSLSLFLEDSENFSKSIFLPENGLYQNFLITGTIGSGKTSAAMYPFTKQLLSYNAKYPSHKIGMLILDAKGNYFSQVKKFCQEYNLNKDLIILSFDSGVFYNPLHKPHLRAQVLANRLKTILTLFSENNSESYWLDKAEEILTECIKLCRLYNNNYVTFLELHKLITLPNYYRDKLTILKEKFISGLFSQKQIYELNASLDFFEKEFESLDSRTKAILISEITRITNTFISDYDVVSTFCPPLSKLTFLGFDEVIQKGKIVILNLNVSEYGLLSKILATYLKLDFQTEVMNFLAKDQIYPTAFICDEYDKFCTKTDADFFSLSREAKCINIVSTQSYSSLKHTLKEDSSVKVIIQNLINKIWFRSDDIFTIEEAQKQLGKEDKEKISKTISENAKETKFNYITHSFHSQNSNLSESYNTYSQNDYIYDTRFFTQELDTFSCLTFLSNGNKILDPIVLKMKPYFKL